MEASLNESQHPLELVTSFLSIFLGFLVSNFEIQDSVDQYISLIRKKRVKS